jgi:hypothetical protein
VADVVVTEEVDAVEVAVAVPVPLDTLMTQLLVNHWRNCLLRNHTSCAVVAVPACPGGTQVPATGLE